MIDNNTFGLTGVDVAQQDSVQKQQENKPVESTIPSKQEPDSQQQTLQYLEQIDKSQQQSENKREVYKKSFGIRKMANMSSTGQIKPGIKQSEKLPKIKQSLQRISKVRSQSTIPGGSLRKVDNIKLMLESSASRSHQQYSPERNTERLSRLSEKKQIVSQQSKAMIEDFQSLIQKQVSEMYQKQNFNKIINEMKGLEKKKVLQDQIDKTNDQLARQINNFNKSKWEVSQKQSRLKALEAELEQINEQLDPTEVLQVYNQKYSTLQKLQQEYEFQFNYHETLKYMMENRQGVVRFIKKQCTLMQSKVNNRKKQKNLEKNSIQVQNQLVDQRDEQLIKKVSLHKNQYEESVQKNNIERQVEEGLLEYSEKQKFQLIVQYENQLKQEREEQLKIQKLQEQQNKKKEQERKQQEINKQRQLVQLQLEEEIAKFQPLMQVTQIFSVDQLSQYKTKLQETHEQLEQFINEEKSKIEAYKNKITELEETIKQFKYFSQGNDTAGQLTDNIYKLEVEIQNEKDEQNYIQMKLSGKKGILDEICLALSRIQYQFQKPNEKSQNIFINKMDIISQFEKTQHMLEQLQSQISQIDKLSIKIPIIDIAKEEEHPPHFLGLSPKKAQNPKRKSTDADDTLMSLKSDDKQQKVEFKELANEIKAQYQNPQLVVQKI